MTREDLPELTIREAGELIRDRAMSCVELVEAVLRRIDETETHVHAYVRVLGEDALRQAAEADGELQRGEWQGPLHGIPVAVKDLFYTRGVPTEAGSRVLAGFVPNEDATVVRRLREAGAVIVGKTVTHEFAYGQDTPPTRNAWDVSSYPGGSSAGSGVAVAVRSAMGAIGTDSGGSVRIPAALNGVVGLKPTFGLVSRYGVIPMSPSLDHVGPLARTVTDCATLLGAIAGFDPNDATSIPTSGGSPSPDSYLAELGMGVDGVVLGVERSYFFYEGVSEDVRAASERAIRDLEGQGARIVEIAVPELEAALAAALTVLMADTTSWHLPLLRDHSQEYHPRTRVMLELGAFISASDYVRAQRARRAIRDAVKRAFVANGLDALVAPSAPVTTVPIEKLSESLMGRPGETALSAYLHHSMVANLTGQPALTQPCGFSADGHPVGLELLGRPFHEARLFCIAQAYEQAHDWHLAVPPVARGDVLHRGAAR